MKLTDGVFESWEIHINHTKVDQGIVSLDNVLLTQPKTIHFGGNHDKSEWNLIHL